MFDEAAPIDQAALDKLAELAARPSHFKVHVMQTARRMGKTWNQVTLTQDPVTGVWGLPADGGAE